RRLGIPYDKQYYSFENAELPKFTVPAFADRDLTLDKQGKASSVEHVLELDMQYSDANGEVKDASSQVVLWPMRQKLGLRIERQPRPKFVLVSTVLLDEKDNPVANRKVQVDLA